MENFRNIRVAPSYLIDDSGKVWSPFSKRFLASFVDHNGYVRIGLLIAPKKQKLFLLHRLLADAFLPNPKNLPTVNHKNGVKTDNRLINLEWASYQENLQHAYKTGLNRPKTCAEHHSAKLTSLEVREIKRLLSMRELSQYEIARRFGVSRSCILNIHLGKAWKTL